MSLPYETLLETGREDLIVKPDEVLRIAAQAGASYRVVQGQERELVTDVVAVRDGANLILHFADGAKVVIEEYFTLCERGDCDVTLPKEGAPSNEAMEQALASETKEGRGEEGHSNGEQNAQIVYVEGDPGRVMDILKGEPALSNALATVDSEESDGDEGLLYWSLIGVGVAYGAYELFLDDGASTPLPVFADGESVTATIEENSAPSVALVSAELGINVVVDDPGFTDLRNASGLNVGGVDRALDLTLVNGEDQPALQTFNLDNIAGIESGQGTNTLILDTDDVLLSGTDLFTEANGYDGLLAEGRQQLRIDGASGTVDVEGSGWVAAGVTTDASGNDYLVYNYGTTAQLLIDTDLDRVGAVL